METIGPSITDDLKILILEDNSADAELIEFELEESGFIFSSQVVDTKEAFTSALKRGCPTIILSDYELPSFNGAEALKMRKELCPETPFILVTGAVGEERGIEMLTGGATDYVLKRNLSRLSPAMHRALHEAYERRKRKEAESQRDAVFNELEARVRERTEALQSEMESRKKAEQNTVRQNKLLSGINRILTEAIGPGSEEKLGDVCLGVAEEITESEISFLNEIRDDGQLYDISISNPAWKACDLIDKTGHRKPPGQFKIHGLYGYVIETGESLIANDPSSHPASIGLPPGHSPLTSFLGVPLFDQKRCIGIIGVGNREGGYSIEQQGMLETLAPVIAQAILRRRTEEKARRSESQFRMVVENSHEGITMIDLATERYVFMTPSQADITGFTLEELKNLAWPEALERVHPDDRHLWLEQEKLIAEGRETAMTLEYRWKIKGGEYRWFSDSCKIVRNAAGRAVALVIVSRDITDKKNAEAQLRLSEEKYRTLFNSIDAGFCILEMIRAADEAADFRFLEINPAFERHSGVKDVCGRTIRGLYPDIEPFWTDFLQNVAVTGEARRASNYVEELDRWFDLYAFRCGKPDAHQVAVLFNDITDRKRTESNLAFLAEIDKNLINLFTENEIMEMIGRKTGGYLKVRTCNFFEVDPRSNQATALSGWPANLALAYRLFDIGAFLSAEFEEEDRKGKTVVVRDTEKDLRTIGPSYKALNVGAFITVPFYVKGEWKYFISATDPNPRDWRQDEVELFQEISGRVFPRLERARAEAALSESEERYRLIYESSLNGILYTKADGSIISANAAAQSMLEMTEEEIIQAGIEGIMDKADPRLASAFRERTCTGKFLEELTYRKKDGTLFPVEVSSSVFTDRKGQSYASIIFSDITWRKEAERILKKSEKRFREMADAMPQLVWTATPDGVFDYINRKQDEFLELKIDSSDFVQWQSIVHPDDFLSTVESWRQAVQMQTGFKIEHRLATKSGVYRWYLSRASTICDESRKVVKWIGTTTDIHDLKEAEQNLTERTRQLELANKELESFSYSVSHDLRAPLRAIDGYSRMLAKDDDGLSEKARDRLAAIRKNVQKMDLLINDLLNFSKSTRTPISIEEIDMDKLVSDVVQVHLIASADRSIELKRTPLPKACGDQTLIEQVLSNLIENAVKFTKRTRKPIIEIGGRTDKRESIYYVKDNGAGFDMKYYDKLFGVFQRLHSEAEYEGTGIGLAIVQRIIHRHGGHVWAEGKTGKGATFYFSLPAFR